MSMKILVPVFVLAGLVGAAVAADDGSELLPDGSTGLVTEFKGAAGSVAIPAYLRKPKGDGPFPVVVMLHGGQYRKGASAGMGRSTRAPVADFVKAGWAVYCTDYRPNDKVSIEPIETDDTLEALAAVRKLPYIDARRVGLWGASHGANVSSRVIARADLSGAILCAPAAMDLIEVKKADGRGEPVVPILRKLIKDMETKHGAKAEEIKKDPAKYGYSSALTETDKVRCPLLILNARNDNNSPTSIMELYVKKLHAAGKQVETYFPDKGGHGFYLSGKKDHADAEYQEATRRSVAFFQECFKKSSPPAKGAKGDPKAAPKKPSIDQYGSLNWVDPDRTEPPGTQYKTFHSKTINADVSYLVYLPPDYDKDKGRRYPVLYSLHASGGTPLRAANSITRPMDKAIRAGLAAPMIIIFPQGLRGATMYCDSRDGRYPVETVIIKDLIPHVDASYRTVAGREGRALDGFSMGGFGAAHLGFKFPEVFGVVSIQAPPLLGPQLKSPLPVQAWSKLFPAAMGSDLEYFRANDPFTLVEKNADALRDRTVIRIVAHAENENWLVPRCDELHRLLLKHTIAHHFLCLTNVKSHNAGQVARTLGDAGLMFYGSAFSYLQGLTKAKPGGKTGDNGAKPAFAVKATIRKVDVEKGLVVFSAGQRDRAVHTAKDFKVLDRAGKELAGGLGSPELKPGTEVTITVDSQDGKGVVKMIRLGATRAPPPPEGNKAGTKVDPSNSTAQPSFVAGSSTKTGAAEEPWDKLPNGIEGRLAGFEGVGGVKIAGYVRKPAGAGPFPLVIVLHGGGPTAKATSGATDEERAKKAADEAARAGKVLGSASNPPIPDFLTQGWAVYSIDYRTNPRYTLDPLEWEDTVIAVNKARSFPFVDPKRVAMIGGSHGGHVTARMASRVDLSCAVICAPAGLDLIALSHLAGKGTPIGGNQRLIREMEQRSKVKMADIEKDPTTYGYSSPLSEIAKVRCPILMISGRNDNNAPLPVMEAYVSQLRAAGKKADAYHPDNGPHGFYWGIPHPIPETAESTRRAVAFIKQHFEKVQPGVKD